MRIFLPWEKLPICRISLKKYHNRFIKILKLLPVNMLSYHHHMLWSLSAVKKLHHQTFAKWKHFYFILYGLISIILSITFQKPLLRHILLIFITRTVSTSESWGCTGSYTRYIFFLKFYWNCLLLFFVYFLWCPNFSRFKWLFFWYLTLHNT
jgi:hypothetical protein